MKDRNSRCISHGKEKKATDHHVHSLPWVISLSPDPAPGPLVLLQSFPDGPQVCFVLLPPAFSCTISCWLWRNPSLVHHLVCRPCCQPLALLTRCEAVPWLVKASPMLQSLLAHPALENSPVIAVSWQTQQAYGNCNKINFSEQWGKLPKCNLFLNSLPAFVSIFHLEDACNRQYTKLNSVMLKLHRWS